VSFFRLDQAAAAGGSAATHRRGADAPRHQVAVKPASAAPSRPAAPSKPAAVPAPVRSAAPAKAASPAGRRGSVGHLQATLATAFQEDADWKEF